MKNPTKYLDGVQVEITTPELKKLIGKKNEYLREMDIDKSGRGYFYPRSGVISEIYRKHIFLENGDCINFSQMHEIVLK